jgi:hypothetical protein
MRDQVREPLHGDRIAVADVGFDGLGKGHHARHGGKLRQLARVFPLLGAVTGRVKSAYTASQ